ncbi:MAG: pentapeptide repeat-containing protein [Cyanobacteria bacterium SID2]|nr:pentapeptide repeat-containing protein [Cyanobacteria bacterium SID2]MBP0003983.1 pentapeptide repeat-containing protein [Cyanobacteria bacterium SBC]
MEAEELLTKYAKGVRRFIGVNLSEANLSQASLSRINLRNACLSVANLSGANLERANLKGAKLNVAKLSSSNLRGANLRDADLNVANLIRADLTGADLFQASLIRTEMLRADLSGADLRGANLSGAMLKEAKLPRANFLGANLSEVDLSYAQLQGANLEQATFRRTNLRWADLSGASLRNAELRQVKLSGAKLIEADLRGANLRWADLSGANLSGADLSGAKLSGANLSGADLSGANLIDTSLVYADLTRANLIGVDWMGADLSGANLTGVKLHGVSRFGLKSEGTVCQWVDLSANGDGTHIQRFRTEQVAEFFNESLPTVRILVDAVLDPVAHVTLARVYAHISQHYSGLKRAPNLEVSDRRTVITFLLDNDIQLFPCAYITVLPFQDADAAQTNIKNLVRLLQTKERENLNAGQLRYIERLRGAFNQTIERTSSIQKNAGDWLDRETAPAFFQAPTHVILSNSKSQTLEVRHHPRFGKQRLQDAERLGSIDAPFPEVCDRTLPPPFAIFDFVKTTTPDLDIDRL